MTYNIYIQTNDDAFFCVKKDGEILDYSDYHEAVEYAKNIFEMYFGTGWQPRKVTITIEKKDWKETRKRGWNDNRNKRNQG